MGIDPGTTAAVALLDVDSSFFEAVSMKDFGFSGVCDYIVSKGDPVIIATDKKDAPDFVQKVAATFGAKLFVPKENLTLAQKEALTKKFRQLDARSASSGFSNDHEKDAMASAVYAKKNFSSFFQKIDKVLERRGFEGSYGDVKELLIKEETGNIEQALKLLAPAETKETKIVSRLVDSKSVLELRKRLASHEKENQALRKRAAELEQRIKQLDERLKDEQIRRKARAIAPKPKPAEPAEPGKDHYVVVEYEPGMDVRDKVVIASKRADIAAIAKKSPRAIVAANFSKKFDQKVDVPVLLKETLEIKNVGGLLVAEKVAVDDAIKRSFISWLRDYKTRHANFSKKFDQNFDQS